MLTEGYCGAGPLSIGMFIGCLGLGIAGLVGFCGFGMVASWRSGL